MVSEEAISTVFHWLLQDAGLRFPGQRGKHACERIRRAMQRAGYDTSAAYLQAVRRRGGLFDDLIAELTVGETYFFRDPKHFNHLEKVLPELLGQRPRGHVLRLWSAGCATGEEAYTLAIVLRRAGLGERSQILATDVSRRALQRAREAVYTRWSVQRRQSVGLNGMAPYFEEVGKEYHLRGTIREKVRFEYHNLAETTYPSLAAGIWGMDVILCRNVMIYFEKSTTQEVAERFFRTLAPGGWLVAGPSDPPLHELAPFRAVVTEDGVFYRRPAIGEEADEERPVRQETARPVVAVPAARAAALPRPSSAASAAPRTAERTTQPRAAKTPEHQKKLRRPPEDVVAVARQALFRGDWPEVVSRRQHLVSTPDGGALFLRALSNLEGTAAALHEADQLITHHVCASELHFLHALFLIDLDRDTEAVGSLRRTLYLDDRLAVAHLTLGSVLRRRGDGDGARRAFRNALQVCAARPDDEEQPLADGATARRLAAAAQAELDRLNAAAGATST